jgi:hypothetical protein
MSEGGAITWFEKTKAQVSFFPFKGPSDAICGRHEKATLMTALYVVLQGEEVWHCSRTRHMMLRTLLKAGADPNAPCYASYKYRDGAGWVPLELVNDDVDTILLLEAGATIPTYEHWRQALACMPTCASSVLVEFQEASFRATAVVWCLEALRGTSSWPDMSFLLTKIIMDVSK